MKMKKFLMLYFIFVFLLSILYSVLRLKEVDAQEQETVSHKNQKKKIVLIFTDKFPIGRVICQTPNGGTIFYYWKSVKDAILEMEEVKERYRKCESGYNFFIQYDRCPY